MARPSFPGRVIVDGQQAAWNPPYEVGAILRPHLFTEFTQDLLDSIEADIRATVQREAPEIARTYDLTVTVAHKRGEMINKITIALTSRSAVDQLAELGRE